MAIRSNVSQKCISINSSFIADQNTKAALNKICAYINAMFNGPVADDVTNLRPEGRTESGLDAGGYLRTLS